VHTPAGFPKPSCKVHYISGSITFDVGLHWAPTSSPFRESKICNINLFIKTLV
jgi:hypothetical protein